MRVRGHHLVCTYCFYGSGKEKAEEFFGNANAIPELLARLRADPDMEIQAVTDVDDVCVICPLVREDGCGRSADVIAQNAKLCAWDRTMLEKIGLREGETIRARDLEERLRRNIPDVGAICTNCSSASPSGWSEYRRAIEKGLWPADGACADA